METAVATETSPSAASSAEPLRPAARLGLVVGAAIAFRLAFPPFGLAALALFALAPFLIALRGLERRAAFAHGFGWGLLAMGSCASWFVQVFHSVRIAATFWCLLAIYPAIYAAGHSALAKRGGAALAIGAPCLWLALEWFRCEGWFLKFGWFTPGHALGGDSLLRQNADILGVYGLSLFAFVIAFLIERAVAFKGDGRTVILVICAVGSVVSLYARGNRALGFAPPQEVSEGLRVLAVQDERFDEVKPKAALVESALSGSPPPDVILWPECSFFHDPLLDARERATLGAVASRARAAFIFGCMKRHESQPGREWNAAVVLGPNGQRIGEYHKRVPVQFVEAAVVPGDTPGVFDLASTRIGVLTCYDGTYPFVARELAGAGARAILTPSMDPAEWGPLQHAHHALFYPLRACEVRRPIVRAASSGTTFALDAYGRELARKDPFDPGTIVAVVEPREDETLWVRFGWLVPWLSIAGCAVAVVLLLTGREAAR